MLSPGAGELDGERSGPKPRPNIGLN
jgi:hypothetical protein